MPSIVTLTLNPAVDLTWKVDRLDTTGKNRAHVRGVVAGGGGINVARGVTTLGGRALAVHTAGGDVGRRLGRLLDEEGIDHRAVDVAGETREALVLLATDPPESYHVVPPGPEVDDEELRACLEALAEEVDDGCLVVVSGSLPEGLAAGTYAEVARRVGEAGGRAVLDTSGDALEAALDQGVFLVKANRREAAELVGRELESFDDARAANEQILDHWSVEVVVTTLGADGALCSSAAGHHEVRNPPLPGEAISDAGAGDSLVAGIVAGLAAGEDPVGACARGIAAAAASVLTPGTELFERNTAERLRSEVAVRDVTDAGA